MSTKMAVGDLLQFNSDWAGSPGWVKNGLYIYLGCWFDDAGPNSHQLHWVLTLDGSFWTIPAGWKDRPLPGLSVVSSFKEAVG